MRILAILLFAASGLCRADSARDARWQQDIDYLHTQLPAHHINLFFNITPAQWDQACADLRAAVPNLSDMQVLVGMSALVALPGDAHTVFSFSAVLPQLHFLPLKAAWFQDGFFVTAAGADYSRAEGARIIQIGSQPVDQVYQAISTIVSHENDEWVRAVSPSLMVCADILQAMNITPENTVVPVTFQDLSGNQFTLNVATLDPGTLPTGLPVPDPNQGFTPLTQRHRDQYYWFTYLADSKTLYFGYNQTFEQTGYSFAQFNTDFWQAFDNNPVERIVVDMRNNTGGSDVQAVPWVASATARNALQKVAMYAFVGHPTISGGIDSSVALKRYGMTFIGEPTGGSVNHYGNVRTFNLPVSNIEVSYSIEYHSFPDFPPGPLVPDIVIPQYSADYFARHDVHLAAAFANATPRAAAPPQDALPIVNAATLRPNVPVVPGALATLFGNFSGVGTSAFTAFPLPTQMNGVQLLLNGTAAPLLAVGPLQINFQVPSNVAPGTVPVTVQLNGATILTGSAQIAATGPGIFVADGTNIARPGIVLDQNGNLVTDSSPTTPGSVVRIYTTGQSATDNPQVFFGADLAQVISSAPDPVVPGLWQIAAQVPQAADVDGQMPVFVISGGNPSNGVTVRVAASK